VRQGIPVSSRPERQPPLDALQAGHYHFRIARSLTRRSVNEHPHMPRAECNVRAMVGPPSVGLPQLAASTISKNRAPHVALSSDEAAGDVTVLGFVRVDEVKPCVRVVIDDPLGKPFTLLLGQTRLDTERQPPGGLMLEGVSAPQSPPYGAL
jgi:hypothetical protein